MPTLKFKQTVIFLTWGGFYNRLYHNNWWAWKKKVNNSSSYYLVFLVCLCVQYMLLQAKSSLHLLWVWVVYNCIRNKTCSNLLSIIVMRTIVNKRETLKANSHCIDAGQWQCLLDQSVTFACVSCHWSVPVFDKLKMLN